MHSTAKRRDVVERLRGGRNLDAERRKTRRNRARVRRSGERTERNGRMGKGWHRGGEENEGLESERMERVESNFGPMAKLSYFVPQYARTRDVRECSVLQPIPLRISVCPSRGVIP